MGRPLRRWMFRGAVIGVFTCLLGAFLLLLGLEYRPAWYVPVHLNDAEVQASRKDATRLVDEFGDNLVAGETFEVVVQAGQINSWLAGLGDIWPEARRRIPQELVEPMIAFHSGAGIFGARLERNGWRAIYSHRYTLEVSRADDSLVFGAFDFRLGVVPLPKAMVWRFASQHLDRLADQGVALGKEKAAVRMVNRFVWPNGDRAFRIERVTIEPGLVRLRIDPI